MCSFSGSLVPANRYRPATIHSHAAAGVKLPSHTAEHWPRGSFIIQLWTRMQKSRSYLKVSKNRPNRQHEQEEKCLQTQWIYLLFNKISTFYSLDRVVIDNQEPGCSGAFLQRWVIRFLHAETLCETRQLGNHVGFLGWTKTGRGKREKCEDGKHTGRTQRSKQRKSGRQGGVGCWVGSNEEMKQAHPSLVKSCQSMMLPTGLDEKGWAGVMSFNYTWLLFSICASSARVSLATVAASFTQ